MRYGYKKEIHLPFGDAVEKVKVALAKEGFGVLTEIDVQATLKKKLNVEYDRYVIIGACNPPLAYQAFQEEKDIGLLLPCNVIVYEDKDRTFVAAILPTVAMEKVQNSKLSKIAKTAEEKLKLVIDNLA